MSLPSTSSFNKSSTNASLLRPDANTSNRSTKSKRHKSSVDNDSICSSVSSRSTKSILTTANSTSKKRDDEQLFEVEKILSKKEYKGKLYYKLRWVGCEEPTWELASNCTCDRLIQEFENNLKVDDYCLDEDDNEWEVEKILDKRIHNEMVEYLVKWKGWPGEATWELSDNCECINLIAAFENPKLKKLWDFRGNNLNLWTEWEILHKYMEKYIKRGNFEVNLLNLEPDFPPNEKQLDLDEGINIGPLRYEGHWYLVIILVNHICVNRRILVGDSLNTLIGTSARDHPVIKRLSRTYTHFPIKPLRLTQMDRSDVCAYHTLAAFERALFVFSANAQFIVDSIFYDTSRAELIRSEIKPESDGEISVALPIPEAFDHGPKCEFCERLFESRKVVDDHIQMIHMRKKGSNVSIRSSPACSSR